VILAETGGDMTACPAMMSPLASAAPPEHVGPVPQRAPAVRCDHDLNPAPQALALTGADELVAPGPEHRDLLDAHPALGGQQPEGEDRLGDGHAGNER
jgi:hypothetical protein